MKIQQLKIYTGNDLNTVFFRPIVHELSDSTDIKVMLNMPVPTVVSFWKEHGRDKHSITLNFEETKHEISIQADEYYFEIYNKLSEQAGLSLNNVSGVELEQAECDLFRETLSKGIKHDFWGGVIEKLNEDIPETWQYINEEEGSAVERILNGLYHHARANAGLFDFPKDDLGLFVTTNIYREYEEYLYDVLGNHKPNRNIYFKGVRLYDIGQYITPIAILTPKKNLVLALNTTDFTGCEVRMWYNPDEMKNRQRAAFAMAGQWLVDELVCFAKI